MTGKSDDWASDPTPPNLPPWKAFVVQISAATTSGSAMLSGRIEHLSSGERVRFDSEEEMIAAIRRILGGIES